MMLQHHTTNVASPCCGVKQTLPNTNAVVLCGRLPNCTLPRLHAKPYKTHKASTRTALAAAATAEAPPSPTASESAQQLSSAETACTIVDITNHATLSTISEDGSPLGTYVTYVLTKDGSLILRLRADAVHTANLRRDNRCSLFVHPQDLPARLLGR